MKRVINLDIHVVSINSMYYANKAHGYKPDVKEWIQQMCYMLSTPENKQIFEDLRNYFDPTKHCYTVYLDRTDPAFYNKKGLVNSHCIDVTNSEKLILDLLFTPAFHGTESTKFENLNIDDKFVTTLISRKKPGSQNRLKITLKICKLP